MRCSTHRGQRKCKGQYITDHGKKYRVEAIDDKGNFLGKDKKGNLKIIKRRK